MSIFLIHHQLIDLYNTPKESGRGGKPRKLNVIYVRIDLEFRRRKIELIKIVFVKIRAKELQRVDVSEKVFICSSCVFVSLV